MVELKKLHESLNIMMNINNQSNPKTPLDNNCKKQKADYIIKSKININTIDLMDHLKENYRKDEELLESFTRHKGKFSFIKFKT